MILPSAPAQYTQGDMNRIIDALRRGDGENFKRTQDIELVRGKRLILTAPDGGQWSVTVSNAGVLSATAI